MALDFPLLRSSAYKILLVAQESSVCLPLFFLSVHLHTALLIFFTRVTWARLVPSDLLTFHWIIPDPLLIIFISTNLPDKLPNRLIFILWISPDKCAFIDHKISSSIDSGKQNSHSPLSALTASTLAFPRSK